MLRHEQRGFILLDEQYRAGPDDLFALFDRKFFFAERAFRGDLQPLELRRNEKFLVATGADNSHRTRHSDPPHSGLGVERNLG
jgi:hypothetical protein